jgi:CheY-like chemotaxis protein
MENDMPELQACRELDILLVEDNLGDVRLTQEAIKDARIPSRLHVVEDGAAALNFLYQREDFESACRPDLILMDLNLPKKTGHEVLAEIKQNKELKSIPVLILTSSHAQEDVSNAYQLHANCYITKPVEFPQFDRVIRAIEEFWFNIATLPLK